MEKEIKLDPDEILKSLPKGFVNVGIPKGTRTVDIFTDLNDISLLEAKKAVKSCAKSFKLTIIEERANEDSKEAFFRLEDPKFNKEMRAAAKEMLKAVNAFYSKYDPAYRYDDIACDAVAAVIRKANHDE